MTTHKKHAVLLIGYSRPLHMSRVLDEISKYYPDQLYIFVDGIGSNASKQDLDNNSKVIDLASNFIGAKNININISQEHLGCGIGPYRAIDWALSNENEIIILEDDILPTSDFFDYMDRNLEELNHSDCMMISSNKYGRFPQFNKSIKTRFTFTHGWATWKRSWNHYDYRLTAFEIDELLDENLTFLVNKKSWHRLAEEVQSGKNLSYWDYQWQFSVWKSRGWSLQPPRNLTTNIGFGKYGTHTAGGDWRESITAQDKGSLIKSGYVEIGVTHNLINSIYRGGIPSFLFRKFGFKI